LTYEGSINRVGAECDSIVPEVRILQGRDESFQKRYELELALAPHKAEKLVVRKSLVEWDQTSSSILCGSVVVFSIKDNEKDHSDQ